MTESTLQKPLPFNPSDFGVSSTLAGALPFNPADLSISSTLKTALPFSQSAFYVQSTLKSNLVFDTSFWVQSTLSRKTSLEFNPDVTAPVLSSSPFDTQTSVDIAADIFITANEPIRKADGTVLTNSNVADIISIVDETPSNIPFTATIDTQKKLIVVQISGGMAYNTTYTVTVSGFEDYSGNEASDFEASFTTKISSNLIGSGIIGTMIIQ